MRTAQVACSYLATREAQKFPVDGAARTLCAGDWVYLPGGTPHAVEVVEDARILVTLLFVESA